MANTNENKNPQANSPISALEKAPIEFLRSQIVTAAIVGMANKKENSTIVFLLKFMSLPAIIVVAERETPGIPAKA